MADEDVITKAAEQLTAARATLAPIPPLSETYPELRVADAYAVQQRQLARALDDGASLAGWKIGLTSRAMQAALGVDEPDYGPVLDTMHLRSGARVPLASFIQPKIEAEITFWLGADLAGPGVGRDEAAAAVAGVSASLEIIDSRVRDWRIRLVDTIADLGSCGAAVVSDTRVPLDGRDLRLLGMVLEQDGVAVASGAGAAVLGDPLEVLVWAANTLGGLGTTLRAGQFVMSGALHAAVAVSQPSTFAATFAELGRAEVTFTGQE